MNIYLITLYEGCLSNHLCELCIVPVSIYVVLYIFLLLRSIFSCFSGYLKEGWHTTFFDILGSFWFGVYFRFLFSKNLRLWKILHFTHFSPIRWFFQKIVYSFSSYAKIFRPISGIFMASLQFLSIIPVKLCILPSKNCPFNLPLMKTIFMLPFP